MLGVFPGCGEGFRGIFIIREDVGEFRVCAIQDERWWTRGGRWEEGLSWPMSFVFDIYTFLEVNWELQ